MARSYKKWIGHCCSWGGNGKKDKRFTSKRIRKKARQLLHIQQENFDTALRGDRNRGNKRGNWDWWYEVYFCRPQSMDSNRAQWLLKHGRK